MSSHYLPLLIVCLLLGVSGGHSLTDLGKDRKLLKRGRGCRNQDEYLCDCELVSAMLYNRASTVFQRERLDCVRVCEGEVVGDCKSSCETVFCVAKYGDYCASKLNRTQANSIRLMDCEFSASLHMHVCTKDEYRMEVDNPTFIAVTNGSCVPACGVEEKGLMCHFNARLFGDPFIPRDIEAPVEPPEITPPSSSSVMENEDEIPVEPPSAAYSYEDYEPVGEPSLEDIYTPISPPEYEFEEYSIPEPALEQEYSIPEPSFEEEYSIPEPSLEEEYSIPEPSPEADFIFEEPPFEYEDNSIPEPSFDYELEVVELIDKAPVVLEDEFFAVDIASSETARPTPRTEVYYGAWSNCTQHCAQARNGTRERSVLCRNLFGIPIPPSECRAPMDVDLVESCPTVNCVGEFYYLLSEWSACSQTCSTFITETESMSVGTRRRTMYCFHENGTETETINCAQQVENLDFLEDTCGEMPCSPVRYRVSRWTDCSCQTNTRTRTVECVDNGTRQVLDAMCNALEIQVPSKTQSCIPTGC